MDTLLTCKLESPLGDIVIRGDDAFIYAVSFNETPIQTTEEISDVMHNCKTQLSEYFAGTRKQFDLPLHPVGTNFQSEVWKALIKINYAATASYMDLAKTMGDVKSVRAVGAANGKNPIAIIIPCHRVIGSNSALVGYAGGLWRKQWLLGHEAEHGAGVRKLL